VKTARTLRWLVPACLLVLVPGQAFPADGAALVFATDQVSYVQGAVVQITATNRSDAPVQVVDRVQVDGGFATLERLGSDGTWQLIELIAAANVTTFRTLRPGERHRYRWPTIGYNRADSVAAPGTYRIRFGPAGTTRPFAVRADPKRPRAPGREN